MLIPFSKTATMPDCVRVRLTGPTTKACHTTAWQFNKKNLYLLRIHKQGTDIELEHFSLSSKCDQHVLTCSHCSSMNTLRAISTSFSCLRRGDSPEHVRWRWRVSEVWYCRLATDSHNPTGWYLISRCSAGRSVIPCTAGRSVIDPRARRSLMIRWGSGSKPPLLPCGESLLYIGAAKSEMDLFGARAVTDVEMSSTCGSRREDETESARKNKHRATADVLARTRRQISRPHPAGRCN
ncbi:hypothetical protein T07_2679 [Trichinella nelsoni]|uniref:Uncharacterized protein n=1 Tax=Trichinella nelsoni TaxID=6336 RepID=A0A0V0SBN9_9BILA|nr:hypothetical protein T07_2679 [Trichinella nelsoni]